MVTKKTVNDAVLGGLEGLEEELGQTLAESRKRPPTHGKIKTWTEEELHTVESTPWVQSKHLPDIPARPGMANRWVRYAQRNEEDIANWSQKEREGWRPFPPEKLPKAYKNLPRIDKGDFAGFVGFRGNILCERPLAISKKFFEMNRRKIDSSTETIERELAAQALPGAPIMQERSSRVVREVKVAADE